jgi:competence protein ComEC
MDQRNGIPWKKNPFLRIAPPFLMGITLGWQQLAGIWTFSCLIMIGLTFLAPWSIMTPSKRWAWKELIGISFFCFLIASGILCSYLKDPRHFKPEDRYGSHIRVHLIDVTDVQQYTSGQCRATGMIWGTIPDDGEHGHRKERILLNIRTGRMSECIRAGDQVAITVPLQSIQSSGNPGSTDMANLYACQGIFHQADADENSILILEHQGQSFWESAFQNARSTIETILHRYVKDNSSAALAVALLTGYRTVMDPDLLKAYTETGTIHVIAISGLHLGLIYALLNLFMSPLASRSGLRWLPNIISLPLLWLFSFFTGGSASVIRSAAMYSISGISNAFGRKPSMINGLAASSVLLLAYRPAWITDIGFQLSYTALMSIGIFQPFFRNLIRVTNPMASWLRDLVSVTLAAQVLTLPLVAFHFHQIPLLFLPSNLLAVPLSSLILLLEIGVCSFSTFPYMANPLGTVTEKLINIMNDHVLGMNRLPHSVLGNINMEVWHVIACYGMITGITIWLLHGNRKGLIISLIFLLAISTGVSFRTWKRERQSYLIVLKSGHESLQGVINGGAMLVLYDKRAVSSANREKTIRQALLHFGVEKVDTADLSIARTIHWGTGTVDWHIVTGNGQVSYRKKDSHCILNVVSSDAPDQPEGLSFPDTLSMIIADGSCPLWKIQQWKSVAERLTLRFHSVPQQGAFIQGVEYLSCHMPEQKP